MFKHKRVQPQRAPIDALTAETREMEHLLSVRLTNSVTAAETELQSLRVQTAATLQQYSQLEESHQRQLSELSVTLDALKAKISDNGSSLQQAGQHGSGSAMHVGPVLFGTESYTARTEVEPTDDNLCYAADPSVSYLPDLDALEHEAIEALAQHDQCGVHVIEQALPAASMQMQMQVQVQAPGQKQTAALFTAVTPLAPTYSGSLQPSPSPSPSPTSAGDCDQRSESIISCDSLVSELSDSPEPRSQERLSLVARNRFFFTRGRQNRLRSQSVVMAELAGRMSKLNRPRVIAEESDAEPPKSNGSAENHCTIGEEDFSLALNSLKSLMQAQAPPGEFLNGQRLSHFIDP